MNFKEVYKSPLRLYYNRVFTSENKMAFDFHQKYLSRVGDNNVFLTKEQQELIVNILNGKSTTKISEVSYRDYSLYIRDKCIGVLRGWGYLTGSGGLNLPPEEAARVQDEFGNWVAETLSGTNK